MDPIRVLARHQIFDVLSHSRARLLAGAPLGDGFAAACWFNADDAPSYRRPGHHTLSLYLEGGHGTYRREAPSLRGEPGRICILPAGHESHWVVESPQRFMHLYFDVAQLAPLALRLLDREPRDIALPELTFIDDPRLARPLHALATLDWSDPQARLQGNAWCHEALAQLLLSRAGRAAPERCRGGLAPATRRRVADWIEAHLDRALSVGQLAELAALSEHHFARMFRLTFGMAPHAWVLQRRLARAQTLLHGDATLDRIARDCGLSSAAHLVRRFRARMGMTPGDYRRAVRS